jgi:hypothetical protein
MSWHARGDQQKHALRNGLTSVLRFLISLTFFSRFAPILQQRREPV